MKIIKNNSNINIIREDNNQSLENIGDENIF